MISNVDSFVNLPSGTDAHSDTAERERREAALDETIAQSFPASDPLSSDPNPDNHTTVTPRASTGDT